MESFVLYYTISKNYEYAHSRIGYDLKNSKGFISIASKICALESQTFLSDHNKRQLKNAYQTLKRKIIKFEIKHPEFQLFEEKKWRVHIAFMCTLYEWCQNVNFFALSVERQRNIFQEIPTDWYRDICGPA